MNRELHDPHALRRPVQEAWARGALLLLTLLAFGRALWGLDAKALWWDESLSLQRAELPWGDLILGRLYLYDGLYASLTYDQHPFFSFLLQGLLVRLAGNSEFVLRLPSAMAATLLVPVVWSLARAFTRRGVFAVGAPLWAALLAAAQARAAQGLEVRADALLAAFAAGFQAAACLGTGLGEAATARGWHGTGVFGRIGAAAGVAVLCGLEAEACSHALALAATQASGLVASFGTMAKPMHAGKAAADGLLAAALAGAGFRGASGLLGSDGALARALIQGERRAPVLALSGDWELLANSIKPYAACHLTHPAVDAARGLRPELGEAAIASVTCDVGALALQVTGQRGRLPATALEAKFDLPWCVALALRGYAISAADFREPWHADPQVAALAARVRVREDPASGFASARVHVALADGRYVARRVDPALGHPGNPIGWEAMRDKYTALAEPVLGERALRLLEAVRSLGEGAQWTDIVAGLEAAACKERA